MTDSLAVSTIQWQIEDRFNKEYVMDKKMTSTICMCHLITPLIQAAWHGYMITYTQYGRTW